MPIKLFTFLAIVILSLQYSFAQQKKFDAKLSHPVKFGTENSSSSPKNFFAGTDTLTVVAIMVQFVPDNDGRTTGNGTFDLSSKYYNGSTGRDTVVDAPPYDSAYFADHLKFLKNYFSKSSKGKLNIKYDLYGKVINLPGNMQSYSPQRNENNAKLGTLFQDSWARADSFVNFASYDPAKTAFIIFHAGAGRDIDLSSLLGFDPTPYDIPSVYLGLKNLKEFYGNSYNGYHTSEGLFIQNSLIIPSTELRELALTSGTFLIELGMNGILAANFGSYLGLPDLFNTSNGTTAIGRFGLMDGQSLFSYNGIFPPEPSAWEKIYLGWINPVVISSGNFKIPSSSKNIERDSTIFKVLMSSKEYFLVENRNRDPQNNGQTIYSRNRSFNDSTVYTQDLENGFYYSNAYTSLYKLDGNITDVETYDWSLPGLIDNSNAYKGGILIWHIDENVIDANISSNTINNNFDHRGVDLEEAKGAQEIGVTFSTPFGNITGDGTPVDYWFNGSHQVPTNVYKNAFTPSSYPNSLSYSLANNNINITEFGTIDTLMSFKVSVGMNELKPITNFPKFIGIDTSGNSQSTAFDYSGNSSEEIFANSNYNVYGFKSDGTPVDSALPSGLIISGFGKYIPATNVTQNHKYIVALSDTGIAFRNNLGMNQYFWSGAISSCSPLSVDPTDRIYTGRKDGKIVSYTPDNVTSLITTVTGAVKQFSLKDTSLVYISDQEKFLVTGNITTPTSSDILIVNNSNQFFLNFSPLNVNYGISNIPHSPILADVNSDGKQEIIFVGDGKVYAVNSGGVLIDNFPVDLNDDITSGIAAADINNDNVYDLLFATSNGDLYAYGVNGNVLPGFPVKIGPHTTATPSLVNLNDTLGITIVSGDGFLYGFKTGTVFNAGKILWKNYLKDQYLSNNNFVGGNSPINITDKLPADKVYNWPNPVYENQTFIRYYLNGNASSVNVRILDLSGELVATLKGTSVSRADNEVKWDVSSVQSGIYYGVVEADIDGSTEKRIIKIAVVK